MLYILVVLKSTVIPSINIYGVLICKSPLCVLTCWIWLPFLALSVLFSYCHQQSPRKFPGNKNRIWIINSNPLVSSFLCVCASFTADKVPHSETLNLVLQTRISSAEVPHMAAGCIWSLHCDRRLSSTAAPALRERHLLPGSEGNRAPPHSPLGRAF